MSNYYDILYKYVRESHPLEVRDEVRCRGRLRRALDVRLANGQMLVKCWSNAGQMRYWSNAGRIRLGLRKSAAEADSAARSMSAWPAVKCWSNAGHMLVKCWSNAGQILVKLDVGQMLVKSDWV